MTTLPIGANVVRAHLHVLEAFNSDGSDNISIGYTGTLQAFATNTDVSTTGVKTMTLGSEIGYQAVSRAINAYYVNGGTEPTTGKAVVNLEYFINPIVP
jgi:hypothetical protein